MLTQRVVTSSCVNVSMGLHLSRIHALQVCTVTFHILFHTQFTVEPILRTAARCQVAQDTACAESHLNTAQTATAEAATTNQPSHLKDACTQVLQLMLC